MTTPSETNVVYFTGADSTSVFSYTYQIFDDDDLRVVVKKTSSGLETPLVKTTDYTVSGVGDGSGGSVTLVDADQLWLTGANLATGYTMSIRRSPQVIQETDIRNEGQGYKSVLENQFDKGIHIAQDQQNQLDRSLKIPETENPASYTLTIPAATLRASKYLGFDASGNLTTTASVSGSVSVSGFMETVLDDSTSAAALTTLGITSPAQAILDDTTNAAILTTLGITSPAQTLLDDASVAAMRTTLGLDGESGNITSLDIADAATAQIFQARLTLTTGVPVTTSDVTAAGTIYLTPYKGNKIAVYTGSRWKLMALTEISLALTATSGKNYDVWVYDNSGTLTLETTEWTNDTTRATALATQDGVLCKTGTLTRRYVGTFRASAANQTEDSVAKRFFWNYYNRCIRVMRVNINANDYTYTTATHRQANGSAVNQLAFVQGVAEDPVEATFTTNSASSGVDIPRQTNIGYDSTTAGDGSAMVYALTQDTTGSLADTVFAHIVFWRRIPTAGYHIVTALEWSTATGTTTWASTVGYGIPVIYGSLIG